MDSACIDQRIQIAVPIQISERHVLLFRLQRLPGRAAEIPLPIVQPDGIPFHPFIPAICQVSVQVAIPI